MASRPPRSSSRSGTSKRSSAPAPRGTTRSNTRPTTGAKASASRTGAANRSRSSTAKRPSASAASKKPASRPPRSSTPAKRTVKPKPAPKKSTPKKTAPKKTVAKKTVAAKKPSVGRAPAGWTKESWARAEQGHQKAVQQRVASQKRLAANARKKPLVIKDVKPPKNFSSKTKVHARGGLVAEGIEGVTLQFSAVAENLKIMRGFWQGIYQEFSVMEAERFHNGGSSPSFGISEKWKAKSDKTNRYTTQQPLVDRGFLRNAAISPHMVFKGNSAEFIIDPRQAGAPDDHDYGIFHQYGIGDNPKREFVTITPAWQRVVNIVARNTIFAPLYKYEETPGKRGPHYTGFSPTFKNKRIERDATIAKNRAEKLAKEQARVRKNARKLNSEEDVLRSSLRTKGGARRRTSSSYTLEKEFPRLAKKMHLQSPWKSAQEHHADISHVFRNIDWYTGKKGAKLVGDRGLTRAQGQKIINEATSHTFGRAVLDNKFGR